VVWRDDRFVGRAGHGEFLRCGIPQPFLRKQ